MKNKTLFNRKTILPFLFLLYIGIAQSAAQPVKHGTLLTEKLASTVLRENRIGLDPNRNIKVYLPPGYATSGKSYPVVYYFHSIFSTVENLFNAGNLVNLMERGFANGVVREFIFVAADFSTPNTGSLYENSPVSGRWLDFTTDELVPFIDTTFRTVRSRNSRALVGDFMGGRGALKLAMTRADLFSVAYALHPVATGTGHLPWALLDIDWKRIHQAKSFADLTGDGRSQIFVTVSQAYLPNLIKPPFFCDFFVDMENGKTTLNPAKVAKAKKGFHLEETLDESVANLRSLRGLALDWGRFDPTQGHVYANQAFSRRLEDLGIEHEAEEYRGNPWNRNWTENGRFYARVLPFLARHLVFNTNE